MAGQQLILPNGVRSVDVAARNNGRAPAMLQKSSRGPQRRGAGSNRGVVVQDPVFGEIGTSGLRQYGGFVLEEWLPKLRGRFGAWAYRELMDNSPIVSGIMFAIRQLSRQVTWYLEDDIEMKGLPTGFVETCMHDMSHTWPDFISEGLSHAGYGWALHETVYKHRMGPDPFPGPESLDVDGRGIPDTEEDAEYVVPSSKYSDGLIGWRRLPIRAQETLMRWDFAGYSSLRGMEQVDWHGGQHTIPIGKALLFRTETTRQNPEGRSLLRGAWTSWFAVQNIQTIEAIGIERDLAGIPVLSPPDGVDLSTPAYKQLLEVAEDLVQGIRRDEDEGVVLPQSGWDLRLMSTAGSRQIDTDPVIRRYEQRMTVSLLADFLILGQDSIGSYAMVDVKSDLFGLALDALLDGMCEVVNRYGIPRLLTLNGMKPKVLPKVRHGSVGRVDLRTIGEFLSNLSIAGAPIPWDKALMEHLWSGASLPAPNFDGPKLAAAQPSPTAHDSQWRPSWGSENGPSEEPPAPAPPTERDHVSKAAAHDGAMVALYPSLEVARRIAQTGGEHPRDLHVTLAFLGDAQDLEDTTRLAQVVQGIAASMAPITGTLAGTGVFTAGEEPVSYASPDAPALSHMRERLCDALNHAGFAVSGEHGFTPHITLAYGGTGRPPALPALNLVFDTLSLVVGGVRTDFPLQGTGVQKAEVMPDGGVIVPLAPVLGARAVVLASQFEREVEGALRQLGDEAGRAYMQIADKSVTSRQLDRLVGRTMGQVRVGDWVRGRLNPLLRNHAARVTGDTARVVGQELRARSTVSEQDAQTVQQAAGKHLKIRDLEPQVREAVSGAISEGLAAGENPVQTAARIRQNVPKGRFRHAGAKWRAQLIAREETSALQRAATLAALNGTAGATHVRLRDGIYGPPRSDSDCIARNGEIVPLDEAPFVHPDHPLCTLGFDAVMSHGSGEALAA